MTLKEARAKKLFTMRALAETAGVSLATVRNIEQGAVVPSLSVVKKIAGALEIDPQEVDELRAGIETAGRGRQKAS